MHMLLSLKELGIEDPEAVEGTFVETYSYVSINYEKYERKR